MRITPELLQQIEDLSGLGLRCSDVSISLGWPKDELLNRRKQHTEVEAAWAKGRGEEPARYGRNSWLVTPEIIAKTESLAALGLTVEQLSKCVGTSSTTFSKARKQIPDLESAYQRGRAKGVMTIANALFNKAKNGDTTAMIFFLKNRAPEEWADRRNHELSGPGGKSLEAPLFNYTIVGGPGAEPDIDE
tara:strand:- start:13685 stop:14254 length:570 start_codon:yes stop_codon:yes gene_type:complete